MGVSGDPATKGVMISPVIRVPVLGGVAHDRVTDWSWGTAVSTVGAPTAPTGVTGEDAADDPPVPLAFDAVTVNVYEVPLVRPPTTCDVAGESTTTGVPATPLACGVTV